MSEPEDTSCDLLGRGGVENPPRDARLALILGLADMKLPDSSMIVDGMVRCSGSPLVWLASARVATTCVTTCVGSLGGPGVARNAASPYRRAGCDSPAAVTAITRTCSYLHAPNPHDVVNGLLHEQVKGGEAS